MLRIAPEITQCCGESDYAATINSRSGVPICALCQELKFDGREGYVPHFCFKKSSQSDKFSCEYKHKGCRSKDIPDQNLHLEKTCRLRLEEKAEEKSDGEKNSTDELDDKEKGFAKKVCISCRGLDVEIDFQLCDGIYQNEIGTLQLDYCFRIKGQEDYQFYVKNLKTNEETTYKTIIGEGSLFLEIPGIPFKYKYHSKNKRKDNSTSTEDTRILQTNSEDFSLSNVEQLTSASSSKEELSECSEIRSNQADSCETIEISSRQEVNSIVSSSKNVSCESIETTSKEELPRIFNVTFDKLCSNCSGVIEEENIYYCLFGHDSCKECKGKPCILCQKMMGEAKAFCKNHHKGCTMFEIQENLTKHEIDCEFNNFRCPYPRCVFLNSLTDLKVHFLNSHNKNLIQGNSILEVLNGRKDRKWYMYCFDSLFVCSYYYYGTHIEFISKYIGANDNAKFYRFEVDLKTMKEVKFSRRTMCAGWNDLSLCKGIYFDYEDLSCDSSRFQFTANLRIVNVNNGLQASLGS